MSTRRLLRCTSRTAPPPGKSAFVHRLPDDCLQGGSDRVEVVEQRVHGWFVQDCTAHERGVAGQHPESEVPAAARAEDGRRTDRQCIYEAGCVIRLLLGRGRRPSGRNRTPPVAAPIVGDDSELVGKTICQRVEMTAVARPAHDENNRRAAAADLVVKLGPIQLSPRAWRAYLSGFRDIPAGPSTTLRSPPRSCSAPSALPAKDAPAVTAVPSCHRAFPKPDTGGFWCLRRTCRMTPAKVRNRRSRPLIAHVGHG